jgi:mRNA interferase MazF
MINPQRGEIWLINLDPTQGQEIQKTGPAIVVSTEFLRAIPMRIIIPITAGKANLAIAHS